MAPCGHHLAQLVNLPLNSPIVSRSLLPDLATFSAVSPQTGILLLICASFISSSYHNFPLTQFRVMSYLYVLLLQSAAAPISILLSGCYNLR